ncbi:hypothetical protein GCM10027569_08450 [Flindersiella endophytica]
MRRIAKLTAAALVAALTITLPAVAEPAPNVPAQALDVDREYHYAGSRAATEEIHRQRLLAGPKGKELYTLAEDGKYVVETSADEILAAEYEPQVGIDPVSFEECEQRYDPNRPFWYKNKYNSCSRNDVTVQYFELVNGVWVHVGTTYFASTFIGVAQNGSNTIVFGARLTHLGDEGKVNKSGTTLTLKLGCLNADPARQSTCATTPATVTRTVAEWQTDGVTQPAWFTSTATTTTVPADSYAGERRGFFSYDLLATIVGTDGVPRTSMSPAETFRCDEAAYVYGSHCVFNHVSSSLSLNANDPTYGESATFIRDAQTNITSTKPGTAGKKVPGRFGEEPLHRLYKAYDTENDINGSRRKIRRACRHYFGTGYTLKNNVRQQCDEYPFATTYENAARVDESSSLTYAVRAITGTHNETAGRIYGTWLGSDHILDGDPFYIIIR